MTVSIGQRLKQAREYRLLSLEKASEATRIRVNYLRALEADDYSSMPSPVQGRGFLRNYAEFLDLKLDEIIAEMQKEPVRAEEISGPLPSLDATPEPPAPLLLTESLPPQPQANPTPEPPKSAPKEDESLPVIPIEEKPAKPRGRRKKTVEVAEHPLAPEAEALAAEEKPLKPRGRRKKAPEIVEERPVQIVEEKKPEVETLPVEAEPVTGQSETQTDVSKPRPFTRVASFLKTRVIRRRVQPEKPASIESKAVTPETSVPVSALPAETAEDIFLAIGAELRERRELISLTFNEVEQHTKVRAAFLKLMEEGAFDQLPSPVQTRGMLSNYATFLDLDPDAILLRFADALQARHRAKYPERLRTQDLLKVAPSIPPLRTFVASDLIFGVVMAVLLGVLAVWGVARVMSSGETEQSTLPTAPSISDVLAGTPQPTAVEEVTFVPLAGTQFASITEEATAEPLELPADTNVQVIVDVVERTFIRVSVDGEVVFEGRVVPGNTFTYDAQEQVSVLTGNGAALLIKYNGRDLGLMGDFGQVVSQIYLASGLATPTATIAPTETATPRESLTPTATETVTPTANITTTPTP